MDEDMGTKEQPADLSDAIVLVNQALILLDESGSERQWLTWAAAARRYVRRLTGEGCNDAAGSEVAQVRSGLDLPDQSQSNPERGSHTP